MCIDMGVELLAKVPLEPKLLLSCESGKCFIAEHPDTLTSKAFSEIVAKVKTHTAKKDAME